mgnify:CR=1 FL=1
MNDSESAPPAQKVTKDEIIAVIDQICEKRGQPVVRLDDIVEVESIPVGKQAIKNHLDELEEMGRVNFLPYGQKGVWWIPANSDVQSDTDVGVINWENIDANDIPHTVLAELPEFQDQTYWEQGSDTWGTVGVGAFFLMFVGVIAEILRQNLSLQLGADAAGFFSVVIVGALSVGILSLALVLLMRIMQWLEKQGILDIFRGMYQTAKHQSSRWIRDKLPDTE